MSQLETIADTNGLSNKRRCDKCKKIKVLPAFRYAEGESYNLCIACEYGKRRTYYDMSNQSTLEATKTIAELRRSSGLDKQTLERIAAERADIERAEKEQKTRLPGQFLSLKEDKEKKTLLFTGQYQKVDKPAVDWQTKQEIPGRMTTRFRFQCYDITDPKNPSEALIWERGRTEGTLASIRRKY